MAGTRPSVRRLLALVIALLFGCAALALFIRPVAAQSALEAAERRWQAHGPEHYLLRLQSGALCIVETEVRGERATLRGTQTPCASPARSVPELFALAARSRRTIETCFGPFCACHTIITVYTRFDDELGYPRQIGVRSQRSINWMNAGPWQFLARYRKLPDCRFSNDAEIVSVRALTPLP